MRTIVAIILGCFVNACVVDLTLPENAAKQLSPAQILKQSSADDWRTPDNENVLVLALANGNVIVELAPEFAPGHVANIKALVREEYFDGLAFYRVVEGFVAQGGDPNDGEKPITQAERSIPAELYLAQPPTSTFTLVDDRDGFAAESGYVSGFPVARSANGKQSWLTHCPGAFAMARDADPNSGGATFYIVIGHAPRYLDRNTTVFGKVLKGLEHVQQLRRGYGESGVIQSPENYNPIRSIRVAADLPVADQPALEVMRTDSDAFKQLIVARGNRPEDWFYERPGYVDLCGVIPPVRNTE